VTSPTAPAATPTGLVGRLTTSHWWWRIGIVLVLVALVLVKFGWPARGPGVGCCRAVRCVDTDI
jgi:hypothetical protein